jgi:hypothetical protein
MNLEVSHKLDISSNMYELAKSIQKDIKEKFDVIVTEDSLPEAKKLMANVNKEKDDFKKKYKEFKNEVLAPLVPLDITAREIEGYFDTARAALDNQVKNFEKGKLESIKIIVEKYRDDACLDANITTESITVNDLVILSAVNVNSKGYSIAKKTSDTIDQRIQAVELQIAKAKLEAEEKAKRDREIAENARKEAEESARVREAELLAKAEREKQEALLKAEQRAEKEKENAVEAAKNETLSILAKEEKKEYKPQIIDDKRVFTVIATFEVLALKTVKDAQIEQKLRSMMDKAGITSLKKVEVR